MEKIIVVPFNEVYVRLQCDPGIAQEISQYFTIDIPSAKFSPKFRNGIWDGKIRLFSTLTCLIYKGLISRVYEFASKYDYEVINQVETASNEFSLVEASNFAASLNLPFEPHDFQLEALVFAIRRSRGLIKSPTASGKSLIIYMISEYMRTQGMKILVVVPNLSLVMQMSGDFASYGMDTEQYVHTIHAGRPHHSDCPVVISTWQSIYDNSPDWFNQFDVIIGDEAHLWKAKSLTTIMTNFKGAFRYAVTGTFDNDTGNRLVLEGLFGEIYETASTSELIRQKKLASLQIKSIMLEYDHTHKAFLKKKEWKDCVAWLVDHEPRNRFIKNLALSLKGNTLLLFQFVDKHGKQLYDMLVEANKHSVDKKEIYYLHGKVDGEERERIRKHVDTIENAIIVASFGVFSTGANVVNIHNVIFASPFRSKIRGLQSIGRALRKGEKKDSATLYDVADNVSKLFEAQYVERNTIYTKEEFPVKHYNVRLKPK